MIRCEESHVDKYSKDAQHWKLAAEFTYSGAVELFRSRNAVVLFPAAILGHHALELLLKSALIRAGHVVGKGDIWGHVLVDLAQKLAKEVSGFPNHIMPDLALFDTHFDELRYPRPLSIAGLGMEEGYLLDRLIAVLRPFAG